VPVSPSIKHAVGLAEIKNISRNRFHFAATPPISLRIQTLWPVAQTRARKKLRYQASSRALPTRAWPDRSFRVGVERLFHEIISADGHRLDGHRHIAMPG